MHFLDYVNLAKEYQSKDIRDNKNISNMLPSAERHGGFADIAYAANPSLSYSVEDSPEYRKYGITPNRVDNNFNEQLANAQGFFSKAYNSLARTLVSEVALGTAEGFSDLLGGALQLITGGNFKNVTDNVVSEYIENLQKDFDESHAIYKPDGMTILNGGLINSAWWLDNLPSIASSLTLLIPSTAATKGISFLGNALGKATRINKLGKALGTVEKAAANGEKVRELNKLGRFMYGEEAIGKSMINLGINSGLQRTMENYQESRQVYNDMFSSGIEELNNMSDEDYTNFLEQNPEYKGKSKTDIAKDIAEKSSNLTFGTDYINIGFDILQMAALRNLWKGFKTAKTGSTKVEKEMRNIERSAAEVANKAEQVTNPAKKFAAVREYLSLKGSAGKAVAAAELSEGVEEAVNYVAQQEGMHLGNVILGKDKENKLGDRLNSYITDGALWDSAFWGWMGGILFESVGGSVANLVTTGKWQNKEIESRIGALKEMDAKAKAFAEKAALIHSNKNIYAPKKEDNSYLEFNSEGEKTAALNKLASEELTEIAVRQMNAGNLGYLRRYLKDENVRKMLAEKGIVENNADTTNFFDNLENTLNEIENKYDNHIYNVKQAIGRLKVNDKLDGLHINPEQIQLIATENLRTQTQLDTLNELEQQTLNDIANEESKLDSKLDKNIDYKSAIRLKALSGQLGMLKRQYEELENKKDVLSIIKRKNLKEQIDKLETKVEGETEKAFVNWLSSTVYKDIDGSWRFDLTSEKSIKSFNEAKQFRDIDDKIIRNGFMGAFNTTLDNFDAALNTFKNDTDTQYLSKLYEELPFIDIYKAEASSQLALTDSQIRDRLYSYNELFQEGKKNLFNHIVDVLDNIASETSIDRAIELLGAAYTDENSVNNTNFNDVKESKIDDFLSTLKALKLDKHKDNIFTQLNARLELRRLKDASRSDKDKEEQETTTTTSTSTTSEPESTSATTTTPVEGIYKLTPNNDGTYSAVSDTDRTKNPSLWSRDPGSNKMVFELPTDEDARNQYMSDDNLFDREPGTDLSKPFTLFRHPFVTIENGKVTVTTKGSIRNLTDAEIAAAGTTGTTTTSNTSTTTTPPVVAPSGTSSTGGVKPEYDAYGDPTYDIQTEFTTPAIAALLKSGTLTKDNANEKIEEIIKQATQKILDKGYSISDYEQTFAEVKECFDDYVDGLFNSTNATRNSAIAECYIFANHTNATITNFEEAFNHLIESFIADTATTVVQTTDGSKEYIYINPEALYNYIAKSSICTDTMFPIIFDGLVKYLQLDKFKDKYILTDGIKTLQEVVNDLNKSEEERIEEIATESIIRCNLYILNKDNKAKDEFDKLELNGLLSIDKQIVNNVPVLFVKSNNQTVGTLTVPMQYVDNSGVPHYKMIVQGLIYDICMSNGNIVCPLIPFFNDLFSNPNYQNAKAIVYDYTYRISKIKDNKKRALAVSNAVTAFTQTNFYKDLDNAGLIQNGNGISVNVLSHVSRLLRYNQSLNINSMNNPGIQQVILQRSLDKWFNKMYNSYDQTYNLYRNPSAFDVSVADINEGELYITSDKKFIRDKKGKSRIANLNSNIDETDSSKPVHRIAVVKTKGAELCISGKPPIHHSGMKVGSTFITIPNRNGTISYIHAHPILVSERDNTTIDFRQIIDSIKAQVLDALDKRGNGQLNYNEFCDIITKIFNKNSLFSGISAVKLENQLFLNFGDKDDTKIVFYRRGKDSVTKAEYANTGVHIKQGDKVLYGHYKLNNDLRNAFIKYFDNFLDNAKINFSHALIQADSNRTTNANYGIAKIEDNGFVIEIGNPTDSFYFRKKYNSYNEFMIENNLFKVTTNINSKTKTNFVARSESNTISRTMQLRIVNKGTRSAVSATISRYQIVTTEDKLKSKLNDKSIDNKGEALVENRIPKSMLNALNNLELLPKNIIFVDGTGTYNLSNDKVLQLINGDINATTDINTNTVYICNSLLSALASTSGRDKWRAARILIHEQLHIKLHSGNEDVYKSIKNIYDEFKDFIKSTDTSKLTEDEKKNIEHLAEFLFEGKNEDEALEEFLVESLTNIDLISALNAIEAKPYTIDNTKHTSETLFEKLFNMLNKLFNWFDSENINEKGLYKKELDTLAGIVSGTNITASSSATATNTTRKRNTRRGRLLNSSVNENNNKRLTINSPSILSFSDRLNSHYKPIFAENIGSAEFEYSCR